MKKTLFLLFVLFMSFNNYGQTFDKVLKTIDNNKVKEISTDRLGNLYLFNDNYIWKYDNNGDSLEEYSTNRYGSIKSIDTSDPYKLLVFFEDYSIVLVLDNYLSQIGETIDLKKLGFDQITAIAHSREGGYWLFDQMQQKVYRLDTKWEASHESIKFTQLLGKRMHPHEMAEIGNKLYISDPNYGIFVFDHFATFMKKLNLKGIRQFQVLNNSLNFMMDNEFCQFKLDIQAKICRAIPDNDIKQCRIEKNRFYTFDGKKIKIYKTN